jgi:hypothetical protein
MIPPLLVLVVPGATSEPAPTSSVHAESPPPPPRSNISKISPRGGAKLLITALRTGQSGILADAVLYERGGSTPGWSGNRKLGGRTKEPGRWKYRGVSLPIRVLKAVVRQVNRQTFWNAMANFFPSGRPDCHSDRAGGPQATVRTVRPDPRTESYPAAAFVSGKMF